MWVQIENFINEVCKNPQIRRHTKGKNIFGKLDYLLEKCSDDPKYREDVKNVLCTWRGCRNGVHKNFFCVKTIESIDSRLPKLDEGKPIEITTQHLIYMTDIVLEFSTLVDKKCSE